MNRTNPIIIIQARMGSTRLPGKSLSKIAGKPLIGWVLQFARKFRNVNKTVVATTWLDKDNPLVDYVEKLGVPVFRGHPEDVLSRFCEAARKYRAEPVIRICGDNPIIDVGYMEKMVEEHIETGADLTCNSSTFPLGPVGEIISANALETMEREAKKSYQREHVTPYIHENPKKFRIHKTAAAEIFRKEYRLTVDTSEDLKMMEKLIQAINSEGLEINLSNALKILGSRQEIAKINTGVKQKNWRESKN